LLFRFLFSVVALPSLLEALEVVTDCPAEISLEPLSDLEGLEDEHRRWWPRTRTGDVATAVRAADDASGEAKPVRGAEDTTHRTEEENIVDYFLAQCSLGEGGGMRDEGVEALGRQG